MRRIAFLENAMLCSFIKAQRTKIIMLLFLTIILIPPIIYTAGESDGYIIREKYIYPINITEQSGVDYLPLKRIADILNGKLSYDNNRQTFIYSLRDKQVVMNAGKSLISIEGRLEYLSNPPIIIDKEIHVPAEFLLKIISQLYKEKITFDETSNSFIMGEESDPFNLRVDTLSKSKYLRVIIQATNIVPFRIMRNDDIIKVKFLRRIVLLPFSKKEFDTDILEKAYFEQESNSTTLFLKLRDEPRDIKSYKFNEPFRIVIDFMRESEESSSGSSASAESPSLTIERQNWLDTTKIKTIILDPGHGGAEEGAIGPTGLKEKDVALQIAFKLKQVIEQNMAGIRVVLTRDSDIDTSLRSRTEYANNNKGDLFISIHCNGSINKNARGAEVYFLSSEASDEATRILAEIENRDASIYSALPSSNRSQLTPILWDLAHNEYMKESSLLAEVMQNELNDLLSTKHSGLKQAPFRVLTGATMPAVLVEMAFITNPQEEKSLRQDEYQWAVARAIYRSIVRFQSTREQKMSSGYDSEEN